jgi:ribosomal protein S7
MMKSACAVSLFQYLNPLIEIILPVEETRPAKYGGSIDELEDPDDVAQAREQLQALLHEQEMADKVKEDLQKQVIDTQQKASQLEEVFIQPLCGIFN